MSVAVAPVADPINAEIEGNRLRLIETGPERLSVLLDFIDGARCSLKFYYYVFESDDCGSQIMDRLIAAVRRGIDVVLMVDSFGSSNAAPGFFDAFRKGGGRFGVFGNRRSTRYLIRNHQKIAIADDQRLIIGGFNLSDHYFGIPDDKAWRDIGLYMEGPGTAEAVRWFNALQAWVMADKQRFSTLRRMIRTWRPADGMFHFLIGGPVRRLSPWAQAVKHDLEKGRQVDMIQAYFSPSRGMLRRIERIGTHGKTRIITASRSDNSTTISAARALYAALLKRGVRIYEYLPAKLHTKLIIIDNIVYIGSANFDMRSLFINLELVLRIEDAAFAEQMRAFVTREIADCEEITLSLHRHRTGIFARLLGWISYVMVSVIDYTVTRRLNFPARTWQDDDD
ncbi:phospholipase D-like domain-containing protein [Rhizorhapis sp. SPR117]|uniref:phospholipase D-like domain-containing protein n=1 Tax=Rhizorhapis sp. SPR117 TaxID=2912611 RepID=UPI001F222597|nr:phosphatidylserine/phosphatidylglycerophosphate/cardiolipin synthase family protein [Rhizorhapis sp. SPR117]